jgi:hypothetical protein
MMKSSIFVMGNHDAWLAHGLPQPRPDWMGAGEVARQHWVHAQISDELVKFVSGRPFQVRRQIGGLKFAFQHYALDGSGADLQPF